MIESMTPSEIKTFDYYCRKLPLWLQNSSCFIEHFKIWFDYVYVGYEITDGTETIKVIGTSTVNDIIENLLNIFDDDYLNYIASFEGSNANVSVLDYGNVSDTLDKIGALFGVTRNFTVKYQIDDSPVTTTLSLSNYTFLILIKAQIIKNYCEGSRQQIEQYYQSCGLPILAVTTSTATCDLVLSRSNLPPVPASDQDDLIELFNAGLLTIDCVGISYSYLVVDNIQSLLIWDTSDWADGDVDGGVWGT